MAATYRTSAAGGGTTLTADRTCTITPAVNDLLVVFCNVSVNTNDAPTCSDGNTGGTYSLIFCVPFNSSGSRLSCFVRDALVPNTTSTVVTVATGANDAGEIVIVAVAGMVKLGAAAVLQSATQANQAAGAPAPAPAFTNSANAANMIVGVVGNGSNPAGMAPPSNTWIPWTEKQDAGQATPSTGLEVCSINFGFTEKTVTWGGNSATAFASGIIELDTVPSGVDVSKLVGYVVLAPKPGVNVTKLIGYVVLESTNVNPPLWGAWSFAGGVVGVAYLQSWDMPTAALTVVYSVLSGALPDGLALAALAGNQAKISGTPTAAGTFDFTIRAVNAYGTVDQAFSITISAAGGGGGGAWTWIN